MIAKCDKIIKHGVNVFVNRQLVYNLPEQYLADHGVMVIEHADFDGIERISRVTGTIVTLLLSAISCLNPFRW
jgi:T-complex protein 1 subunit beta